MERKIGEIFEYNGEWYQCLKEKTCTCFECDFRDYNCNDISLQRVKGRCQLERRKDNKSVIFKKLEKFEEPYVAFGKVRQKYKLHSPLTITNEIIDKDISCDDVNGIADIEIKQNKENMEEYKMHDAKEDIPEFDKIVDECLFDKQELNKEDMEEKKPTYEELLHYYNSTVGLWAIDRSPQEVSLDWICDNAFQLGIDEKDSNSENIGKNLREFNLEAAKAGKPVYTRDGRKARIICFNSKNDPKRPIVALVENNDNELLYEYTIEGKERFSHISTTGTSDLMMLPEKKEGWVNVYKDGLLDTKSYPTKKEAFDKASPKDYVDTIKINWSE